MDVFKKYAEYYDALYSEKDYPSECLALQELFIKYANQPVRTILDLGCGTGGHVFQLVQQGFTVSGVDQSSEMLAIAQNKKLNIDNGERASFFKGDIRSVELNTHFDVVISMFAVMSYMVSNLDLQAALKTARKHLNPGGLFIFDAWHGPGVLSDPPTDRYRIIQQENKRFIRFAHPVMDIAQQSVDVNYKILTLEGDRLVSEIDETHTMRYFFPKEISFHLECAGFEVLAMSPFMKEERSLNKNDWNFSMIARIVQK